VAVVGTVSGTSIEATKIKDDVKTGIHEKSAHKKGSFIATPRYVGTIGTISGATFTISGRAHEKGQATSTPVIYIVNTTSSTVFMKNGKLDSLTDLTVGNMVMVAGSLDTNTKVITATGVNVVGKK
jgi:hypothetical protein